MRLLVTGCTGFLGRNIARLAALDGHEVLGIGRSSRARADWRGEYIQKDLSSDLSPVIRDFVPAVVLHAAGPAAVGLSFSTPLDDLRAGVATWANTLESVRRSKVKPLVVFPSSAAVYGNPSRLPVREADAMAPISPYGFHKWACELLAREYHQCFGLDVMTCRFFSIFGPDQLRLLIWELYEQFVGSGSNVWLDGSGDESRDYLDIDDAGRALLKLMNKARQKRQENQSTEYRVINIASGEEIGVLDLAQKVAQLLASRKPIRCRGSERLGEPRRWRADISLLRSLIPSWRPKPFPVALSQCLAAWQGEHCRFAARVSK